MIEPQPGPYSYTWNDPLPATMTTVEDSPMGPVQKTEVTKLVRLDIHTTGGSATVFLQPDDLEQFLRVGNDKLVEARSGIVRPRLGIVPPNGRPGP